MNKLLKFPKAQFPKLVFISDMHYTHDREFLWGDRGFASVEKHDAFLIENWHKHIDEDTVVFNLGDVVFRDPDAKKFEFISNLPCKAHYMLFGNHNSGSKEVYKAKVKSILGDQMGEDFELYPVPHNNVIFCGEDLAIRVGKKEIHMSHFPKRIWDHMAGYGKSIHLSGHSHGSDEERNVASTKGRCLDVGVENALKYSGNIFFTYDEIIDIMETKVVQQLDHHDENTTPSR